ncbi:MAG: hypothetical protein J0L93_10145 [Deltaproteobacteria bacterium]|nr:hypothetical protein [Deltaproteobacteria bacterium]
MFASIAFLSLISAPFSFEVKPGFSLEPVAGYQFSDVSDNAAVMGGARLSFLQPNQRDAFITGELEWMSQTVFTGKQKTPMYKWTAGGSVAFYEIFNPYAFRILVGGGIERRRNSFNPVFTYRAGLGRFFSARCGIFADVGQRLISRTEKDSDPIETSLSAIIVF